MTPTGNQPELLAVTARRRDARIRDGAEVT